MRTLPTACAVTLAASLLLAPAVAPAFAADSTYTIPLHQQKDLPVTASSAPVPKETDCPVPAGMDGWHFVLPGNSSHFVKLTVTFQPGGQQVITSFGPPSDKHAYVASQPGAQLTSAVAEVNGGQLDWFNLSHTCPAKPASGTTTGGTTTGGTTTGGTTTGGTTTGGTTTGGTTTGGTTTGGTTTGGTTTSGGTGASPTPSTGSLGGSSGGTGGSSSASPTVSSSPASGSLAETGASATTGWLGGAAVVLLAGGGFMVFRRRKAGQH
jgi:LPXTG-motif cell wall-anchored protein